MANLLLPVQPLSLSLDTGQHIWNQKISDAELVGIPGAWTVTMKDFFKGLKNNEAKRKQRGLLKCTEGKSKVSVMLFRAMGDHFHERRRRRRFRLHS